MKRRNFLKGIFGTWAAVGTYFSFKYFENKNVSSFKDYNEDNTYKEKMLGVVEIPIVYHCNLNCAYCDHFAPIAPEYIIPVNVYKKHLSKLFEITNGHIGTIWLLGGEPLLHNDICKIIETTASIFPKSNIAMTTNGLLIDKQDDNFWKTCRKYNVMIMVENYILNNKNINFEYIYEKLKVHNCNLHINTPKYHFRQTKLSKEKQQESIVRYKKCKSKTWAMFDDGKFYSCPAVNGVVKFFNKKFPQYAIPVSKNDVLDIYKINSIDEIIEFYNKPKEMCAHCGDFKTKKWCLSKKEPEEWYKV